MCLPQHSVDVVIRDTAAAAAAVAMVTVLRGASRVFGLGAEGRLADAAVLAVNARPGRGHHGSLWTAGPVAAVAAGRLEIKHRKHPGDEVRVQCGGARDE